MPENQKSLGRRVLDSRPFPLLLFFLFFLAPLLLYAPFFFEQLLPVSGDGLGPLARKIFLSDALSQGELPLWNKLLANGVPNTDDNFFYPFYLLFSYLPAHIYSYVYYAFHLSIAGTFMYLFLREKECNQEIAILTGFLYLFSVHLGGARKSHSMIIEAVVYFPAILFFLEKHLKTRRFGWLALSSAAMALQFNGGMMQIALYADMAAFFYFLFMARHLRLPIGKLLQSLLLWVLIYVGLVSVKLLSTLDIMTQYSQSGATSATFETFKSYSIHFIKLPMMMFPRIFGNLLNQSLGSAYSSEMDIEIFFGIAFCFVLFLGVVRYHQRFLTRLCVGMMVLAFCFAACAHIPFLAEFIYHIPILNGFRVPSRILFVFVFFAYVLFAASLSTLWQQKDFRNLFRPLFGYLSLCLILCFVFLFFYAKDWGTLSNLLRASFPSLSVYFRSAFLPGLLILLSLVALVFLLWRFQERLSDRGRRHVWALLCLACFVCVFFETLPFSGATHATPVANLLLDDEGNDFVSEHIGDQKIWEAFPSIDGAYYGLFTQSRNLSRGYASINAYTSFNNPRMYMLLTGDLNAPFNYSGLLTGSFYAERNLLLQNDLLSMLGVRYISDPYHFLYEGIPVLAKDLAGEELLQVDTIEIPVTGEDPFVYEHVIPLQADTLYKITFTLESSEPASLLYVDFYGGSGYDDVDQNYGFYVRDGTQPHTAYIHSGDPSGADGPVYVRLIALTDAPITVRNFTLEQAAMNDTIYVPAFLEGDFSIFENTRAREILYVPDQVVSLTKDTPFYENLDHYDLRANSYVQEYRDMDLSGVTSALSIEHFGYNSIRAQVESDAPAFLNFSQCQYDGWQAFVNGQRVPIYLVNGLIQGIEIPQGSSTVEFRFVPVPFYLGVGITACTLLFIVLMFFLQKRRLSRVDTISEKGQEE